MVDDEAAVRGIVSALLERSGYLTVRLDGRRGTRHLMHPQG